MSFHSYYLLPTCLEFEPTVCQRRNQARYQHEIVLKFTSTIITPLELNIFNLKENSEKIMHNCLINLDIGCNYLFILFRFMNRSVPAVPMASEEPCDGNVFKSIYISVQ